MRVRNPGMGRAMPRAHGSRAAARRMDHDPLRCRPRTATAAAQFTISAYVPTSSYLVPTTQLMLATYVSRGGRPCRPHLRRRPVTAAPAVRIPLAVLPVPGIGRIHRHPFYPTAAHVAGASCGAPRRAASSGAHSSPLHHHLPQRHRSHRSSPAAAPPAGGPKVLSNGGRQRAARVAGIHRGAAAGGTAPTHALA